MSTKKLLKDYIENNKLNIEQIINDYSGYVYTITRNMAYERLKQEDIEEIISDVFFILWKNHKKMNENDKLTSYFSGVLRNLLKEKNRKISNNLNIEEYENVIIDKTILDEKYEEYEKINEIEKILLNMSKEDNQIFRLYYYSGMKVKEIALKHNISEVKVKTKLFRIRQKIRKNLEERGYRYE